MTLPASPPSPAPSLDLPTLRLERMPAGTRRLVAGYGDDALERGAAWVIPRLLEDGDAADLAWLFSELGEEAVARWLTARGGRQLSGRSRRYWATVLGAEPSPPHPLGEELWTL